jgi:branched-chain amino acid transport system ATP-binding protein
MSGRILELTDVCASYGKVEAVRNVSFVLNRGSIVTIIGANGAGKTTLLNAIMGVQPAKGTVHFLGKDLRNLDVEERVGAGLCLVPEKRELFTTMTVEDNLRLGAYRLGGGAIRDGIQTVFDRFPRLKERRMQLAGTLSGGERQMLAMGRALMGRPRLLMLDEPSLGLAPRIVKDIFEIIVELRKTGVSILLVEQNARAALHVADEAYVMELGEITMQGRASDLAADPRVIETYLGLGGHSKERAS